MTDDTPAGADEDRDAAASDDLDRSGEEPRPEGSFVRRVLADALYRVRAGGMATESVWGIALQVVGLIATFLSFALLGRTLGAAGYGDYAALYAVAGPMITLSSSGVALALLQHSLRYGEALEATARSCLALAISMGLVLTVIGFAIASTIVEGLGAIAIVSLLLVEFVATPIMIVVSTTVQAARSYVGTAQIGLLFTVLRVIVIISLAATGSLTVANLGVTTLVTTMALNVVVLRVIGRRYGFRFVPGRIRLAHLKSNVNFSIAISASALNNEADKFMLAASGWRTQNGLYAAASRVAAFPMIPISVLIDVSHRTFLRDDPSQLLRHARRFGLATIIYGLVVMVAIFFLAPFVPLVLGDEFEGSVDILRWLSPLVMLRGLSLFGLNALMGLDRVTARTVLVVVNAAIGVILYILLVPAHGWRGAVAGTLVSETLEVICVWFALVYWHRKEMERRSEDGGAGHDHDGPDAGLGADLPIVGLEP